MADPKAICMPAPATKIMETVSELQVLKPEHIDEAISLAASGFLHSPPYTYVFASLHARPLMRARVIMLIACFHPTARDRYIFEGLDEKQRLAALKWFFGVNLGLRTSHGRAAFASIEGHLRMVCFFLMVKPCAPAPSTWALLKSGWYTMPLRFGWQAWSRLLQVRKYHQAVERRFVESGGSVGRLCSLQRMVVLPAAQGKGIGSRCLSSAIAEASASGYGVQLGTMEARNVRFYKRLGFHVIEEDPEYFR
jgi:GNAT superfamily N-acetyltransferase